MLNLIASFTCFTLNHKCDTDENSESWIIASFCNSFAVTGMSIIKNNDVRILPISLPSINHAPGILQPLLFMRQINTHFQVLSGLVVAFSSISTWLIFLFCSSYSCSSASIKQPLFHFPRIYFLGCLNMIID